VLMLITITIENYPTQFDLALVQWYDFCFKNNYRLYKYDCLLLKLLDAFDFIPVESIIELVHVIKRAEKQNEYF
ncbi:23677_t:CDS:1, partial [Gigaspora margarita]